MSTKQLLRTASFSLGKGRSIGSSRLVVPTNFDDLLLRADSWSDDDDDDGMLLGGSSRLLRYLAAVLALCFL